ncbi:UDP-N-acetylmuramate dehydrogenase [Marisediminicola senii]|uniref:UDP-N-acetylmuramate dehydrogenase n=1 Tax=Marisediminicola senii TaxID=2711233 RepID=UPI0013EA00A0|nr:UDP-N-acetylmuramate dehydrogenase [Marisediminicola senii]
MTHADTLSGYTTLRVGGTARELLAPGTRAELIDVAREVWASGEEWLALGGGSNVLIGDDGFDGTVIRTTTRGIDEVGRDGDTVTLRVQAGEPWDEMVAHTVRAGLAGMEALSGIPGSCGASPIQNIGAYGAELSDSLVSIEFLDYLSGELETIPADRLGLGYRTSSLKRGRRGIVISIDIALTDDGALSRPVAYDQLASALGVSLGDRVPVQSVRDTVLSLRSSKGMVLDAADPDSVSAGSFFTNPIVTESFARTLPWDAPRWPSDDDTVKVSAAWLIERAGIRRGFALPGSGAGISNKHTLAIINRGSATASDVAELARFIMERVRNEFGVSLQPEPVYVGIDR